MGGGWLPTFFVRRGWTAPRARKAAMLAMALLIVPTMMAPRAGGLWPAVALVSLAAAAHQGWSANVYTLASDMFPRQAVGSVVGIAGMAGALGGMGFAWVVSRILEATNSNYVPIFLLCGGAYVVALGVVHLLSPHLAPPDLGDSDEEAAAA